MLWTRGGGLAAGCYYYDDLFAMVMGRVEDLGVLCVGAASNGS